MQQETLDTPFLPLDRVRILRYFSLFSLLVSLTILGIYFYELDVGQFGQFNDRLFPIAASLYFALSLVFMIIAFNSGQAEYDHLILFFMLDIAAISAMVYSSAPNDGINYLLIMSIAVGNSLVSGQKGYLLAAWATISIIYTHYLHQEAGLAVDMLAIGILGLIFFTTAAVIQSLIKRLHLSIDINKQQADNLFTMEQLTKLVLKRLETGIIVLNVDGTIIFQNKAAQQLMGYPGPIRSIPAQLQKRLIHWQKFPKAKLEPFKVGPTTAKVQPMFSPLMPGSDDRGTVIFIEDTNVVYQQAQRLKQASLGKLTASIAREVREPLKRIYQTVKEVTRSSIAKEDKERTDEIKRSAVQVNQIIDSVMNLSKSKTPTLKRITLNVWMKDLIRELSSTLLQKTALDLKITKLDLHGYFDSVQLRQTITAILENAVYFSTIRGSMDPKITIAVGRNKVTGQALIEITDNGFGVTADSLDHLYEPFYTTEDGKSGLGLYLAKEYCEMNLARLDYVPTQEGAKFRITFPAQSVIEKKLSSDEPFLIRDKVKKVVGF